MDLNKDIYKSKNQFMLEALLFYIDELEQNPLTGSRKRIVPINENFNLCTNSNY